MHEVEDTPCTAIDDPSCVVMVGAERILVYDVPVSVGRNGGVRRLQDGRIEQKKRKMQVNTDSADSFAIEMIGFIEEGVDNGDLVLEGLTLEMSFDNGEIVVVTANPTESPSTETPSAESPSTESPSIATVTSTPSVDPFASLPTSAPSAPTGTNNMLGSDSTASGGPRLSAPYIATIVVAGSFFILVGLMAVSRRKRQKYVKDLEYADTFGVVNLNQLAVKTQPTNSMDSQGAQDPVVMTSFSLENDTDDPFTSSSPSRRSERGPLGSQDELEQSFENEEEEDDENCSQRGRKESARSYAAHDTVKL
jgi:hypothetical protein